ncbi:hypothetical protein FANTH_3034 [Fusarium anthophilum]|uniref:Uncharacterized protein n=1 Tax=Fusarium anthophilum TaxID=48485 RepID=A0A8H4ZT22_9HYPO|nr:hypothetical protein FANTH_3034 [Fusarium anthophilum]
MGMASERQGCFSNSFILSSANSFNPRQNLGKDNVLERRKYGLAAALASTSTGRKCDGYQTNTPSPPAASSPSPVSSPTSIISTYTTRPEARSFQFFIEKTLVNFQTFFEDDLWNRRVLQVAQSTDCIRHAIVALAYYHELYLTHEQWRSLESVSALKHYNLAIKELLDPSPSTSSQGHILVLSCLIFICIELLHGKTDSAIGLFRYGCAMIQQFRRTFSINRGLSSQTKSDVEATFSLADACFRRIAVQLLMLMGDVDVGIWSSYRETFSNTLPLPATSFSSLSDAREAILELLVEQASPGLKGKPIHETISHATKVEQWSQSFDNLLIELESSSKSLSIAEQRAIALLQLHRKYLEINVAKYLHGQGDPCFWDRFTAEFDEIVNCAATAAGLDKNYTQRNWARDTPSEAYFHVDLGYTSVLVSLIARCRDPHVRRRAIAVMLAERVQEGVFNGTQSARVGAKVMELEEARSGREQYNNCIESTVLSNFTIFHSDFLKTSPMSLTSTLLPTSTTTTSAMGEFTIPKCATGLREIDPSLLDLRPDSEIIAQLQTYQPITSEKNVWAVWDKGFYAMYPSHQRTVINWVRRLGPSWTVRLVDFVEGSPNNIFKYVGKDWFPETFVNKTMDGKHAPQHAADLARLPLIYEHGGVWMDVSNMLHIHLDTLFWDYISSPDTPYEMAAWIITGQIRAKWGDLGNFMFAARKNCEFIKNWHEGYKELWKGRTNVDGFHKHPLIAEIGLAEGLANPEDENQIYYMTDYVSQMVIGDRTRNLVDVTTGFNGREFWENKVFMVEGIRNGILGALKTNLDGQKQADYFLTPLDESDLDKRIEAEAFMVEMLEESHMYKMYHNSMGDRPALGDLIKKKENYDITYCPGTFGELYRYGTVHWEPTREVVRLEPQRNGDEIIYGTPTKTAAQVKN